MSALVSRRRLADAGDLDEPAIPDVACGQRVDGSGMYASRAAPQPQVQESAADPGGRCRVIIAVYGIPALSRCVRPRARVSAPLTLNSTRKLTKRDVDREVGQPCKLPLRWISPGRDNRRPGRRMCRGRWR